MIPESAAGCHGRGTRHGLIVRQAIGPRDARPATGGASPFLHAFRYDMPGALLSVLAAKKPTPHPAMVTTVLAAM